MARMYEMNLIIRLQDRASARMRRISGDMSAMTRHAQAQAKFASMNLQSDREGAKILKAQNALTLVRATDSAKYNNLLARRKDLEAQLAANAAKLENLGVTRWQRMVLTSSALTDEQKASISLSAEQMAALNRYEATLLRQKALTLGIQEQEAGLVAEINSAEAAQARLNAQIAKMAPLMEAQARAANQFRRGRAVAHAGSLAFLGGAVATGASALAASSFAQFDVQARKAATQVGDTNLRIDAALLQTTNIAGKLEDQLLDMATQFPASASEMAESAYTIFSSMDLGATASERMANGMTVLTEANKAAVGGQVDLATATDTLITVFNDFDPQIQNIGKNMAELFAIVRFMRGGFAELNAGMNKLAPAAKQAHYSLLDVGAAFAVITQAIPSAAQASTAEARLIDLFGRKQFIDGMERYGAALGKTNQEFSVLNKQTGQLLPIQDIIGKILKIDPSLAQGGPRLTNFIKQITQLGSETGKGGVQGTIFQTKALSVLITEHRKHLDILRQAKRDTVEYEKSVRILAETADVKWKTAMNKLRVAWIEFGAAAMPVLMTVLSGFTRLFEQFNRLSDGNKKLIGGLVTVIGLLGIVGGLLGSAFGGISMVVATVRLRNLQKAIEAVETGAIQTNTRLVRMGTLLRGLGAIGAVAITFTMLIKWKSRNETFTNLDDAIIHGIKKLQGKLGGGRWNPLNLALEIPRGLAELDKWQRAAATRQEKERNARKANQQIDIKDTVVVNKALVKAADDTLNAVLKAYAAQAAGAKKLIAWEKQLAKARAEATQAAKNDAEQNMKRRVQFLQTTEEALRQTNLQGMDLFGGPISSGPVLSAFDDINKTLMGVGVKPIQIPVEFLLQDQQMQFDTFNDWRVALDTLAKRLGPKYRGMIIDLQKQGVASMPQVMSMSKATDSQLTTWKTTWDKMNTIVKVATDDDMKRLTDMWKSYGPKTLAAILDGTDPEVARSKMFANYRSWIVSNIPEVLAKEFADAYQASLNQWMATHPKPKVPGGPTPRQLAAADDAAAAVDAADPTKGYRQPGQALVSPADRERMNRAAKITQANAGSGGMSQYFDTGEKFTLEKDVPEKAKIIEKDGKRLWWNNFRWIPILKKPPPDSYKSGNFQYAKGGIVPGVGSKDTVPAMLTPDEVVLNKRHVKNASKMLGTANHPQAVFDKVDKVQHFAEGGVVQKATGYHFKGVPQGFGSRQSALSFLRHSPGYVSRQADYLNQYWPGLMSQLGAGRDTPSLTRFDPKSVTKKKHTFMDAVTGGGKLTRIAKRFVNYGIDDTVKDINTGLNDMATDLDKALYVGTSVLGGGIHARTILKTYTDPLHLKFWTEDWTGLNPKEQKEQMAFAELVMSGKGVFAPVGVRGRAPGLTRRSAVGMSAQMYGEHAREIHAGRPQQHAFGITPGAPRKWPANASHLNKEQVKGAQDHLNALRDRPGYVTTPEDVAWRKALLARFNELRGATTKTEYVAPEREATIAAREKAQAARAESGDIARVTESGRDVPLTREQALKRAQGLAAARKQAYEARRPAVVKRAQAKRDKNIASVIENSRLLVDKTEKELNIARELLEAGYPEAASNVLNKLASPGMRLGEGRGRYRGTVPVLVEKVLKSVENAKNAQQILDQTGPRGTIHPWSRTVRTKKPGKKDSFDPKAFKAQIDRLVKADAKRKADVAAGIRRGEPKGVLESMMKTSKPTAKKIGEASSKRDPRKELGQELGGFGTERPIGWEKPKSWWHDVFPEDSVEELNAKLRSAKIHSEHDLGGGVARFRGFFTGRFEDYVTQIKDYRNLTRDNKYNDPRFTEETLKDFTEQRTSVAAQGARERLDDLDAVIKQYQAEQSLIARIKTRLADETGTLDPRGFMPQKRTGEAAGAGDIPEKYADLFAKDPKRYEKLVAQAQSLAKNRFHGMLPDEIDQLSSEEMTGMLNRFAGTLKRGEGFTIKDMKGIGIESQEDVVAYWNIFRKTLGDLREEAKLPKAEEQGRVLQVSGPGRTLMQNILATSDVFMQNRIAKLKAEGKWPEGRPSTAEEVLKFHLERWPGAVDEYETAISQWATTHKEMGKEFPIPGYESIFEAARTGEAGNLSRAKRSIEAKAMMAGRAFGRSSRGYANNEEFTAAVDFAADAMQVPKGMKRRFTAAFDRGSVSIRRHQERIAIGKKFDVEYFPDKGAPEGELYLRATNSIRSWGDRDGVAYAESNVAKLGSDENMTTAIRFAAGARQLSPKSQNTYMQYAEAFRDAVDATITNVAKYGWDLGIRIRREETGSINFGEFGTNPFKRARKQFEAPSVRAATRILGTRRNTRKEWKDAVEEALLTIDAVHGIPHPITAAGTRLPIVQGGSYQSRSGGMLPSISSRTGMNPKQVTAYDPYFSSTGYGPDFGFAEIMHTVFHEMGHAFDYSFLKKYRDSRWAGSRTAVLDREDSVYKAAQLDPNFKVANKQFMDLGVRNIENDPAMTQVMDAIMGTTPFSKAFFPESTAIMPPESYRELIGYNTRKFSTKRRAAELVGMVDVPYMGMPEELFGRAYAQFIAGHELAPAASKELLKAKQQPHGLGMKEGWNWSDLEFSPIRKAMDDLFEAKGVRRYAKGGWVTGNGGTDSVRALVTPGEYIMSRELIRGLTRSNTTSTSTENKHETNINIQAADPSSKAIVDALKPILFSLRNQP